MGVGIPGTVSSVTGLVKNANSVWLNGNPLDKDLEIATRKSVKVENDANCLAVSEAAEGRIEADAYVPPNVDAALDAFAVDAPLLDSGAIDTGAIGSDTPKNSST